jgi:hypothetical protein
VSARSLLRAVGTALWLAACHGPSAAPSPERDRAPHDLTASTPDVQRLPEDPAAGKLSEQQWRDHMQHEEDERQLDFDKRHLQEHRAVLQLIAAARVAYDQARSSTAVEKVRAAMPRRVAEIRRRIVTLDHWGVNSRVLPNYDALIASLSERYANAKAAAISGDASQLEQVRGDFDQHLKTAEAWLEEAAESEDEGQHEEGARRK